MGEAKRRKVKDPSFAKVRQRLTTGSFTNPFNSLREFVEYHTEQKGRGYLAYTKHGCFYYGKDDYIGDEDEFLLQSIQDYKPQQEVILVQPVVAKDSLFATTIIPLEKLDEL